VRALAPLLAVAALATACGTKSGGDAPGSASGSATAATPAATAAPTSVDPRIDALARAAAACKAYDTSLAMSCPAMKAWSDAKEDFDAGKSDASLVAMLADRDEKMRYLGALKLNQYGKTFRREKGLAEGVVAAAEREKSKLDGNELGAAVGHILVRETGTFERVKALVQKHDLPDVRRGVLSNLLYANQDDDAVYALVRDTVRDPDKTVAMAALASFWTGGIRKGAETCQLYFENIDNPAPDLSAEASNALAWFGQCSSRYDGLLDSLDARVKAGTVGSTLYAASVSHLCADARTTDKQRARAAGIARDVAQKKEIKPWIRASALDAVMKCDPANGRAFVGKLGGDPEKSVADKARQILGSK
jgi:hypothetical protein